MQIKEKSLIIQKNKPFILKSNKNVIMKKVFIVTLFILYNSTTFAQKTLLNAIKNNDNNLFNKELIKYKFNINSFNVYDQRKHYSLIGYACKCDNIYAVNKLIQKGSKIELGRDGSEYIFDALYVAIENKALKSVDFLIKKRTDINKLYTEVGLTPLVLACRINSFEIANLLLKQGANPNGIDDYLDINTENPLRECVINKNEALVKLLLTYKANIKEDVENDSFFNKVKNVTNDSLPIKNAEKIDGIKGYYKIKTMVPHYNSDNDVEVEFIFYFDKNKVYMSQRASYDLDAYCEGEYLIKKNKDNTIALNYNIHQADRPGKPCVPESELNEVSFQIKNIGKEFYIKSKRFVNNDWQKLIKE